MLRSVVRRGGRLWQPAALASTASLQQLRGASGHAENTNTFIREVRIQLCD